MDFHEVRLGHGGVSVGVSLPAQTEPRCQTNVLAVTQAFSVRQEQPIMIAASDLARETDAVQAAKLIENLLGDAWAFDAAGRWIYLSLCAQTTLGTTLDDLNSELDQGYPAWKRLLHPQEYHHVAALWRHCLQTGDHFHAEFRIRHAHGVYAWARNTARPVRDSQGRITGWFGTSIDIDVYKKTEEALRDRERELSQLVDMVPSQLWRLTPEGETTLVNKRVADFLGVDTADKLRLDEALATITHPDDAKAVGDVLGRCLLTGECFSMKYRLRRWDGVYRWMTGRAEPLRDQDGRIVQWFGLCHDIDDQMHAEDALRRASDQLAQAAQAASLAELSASIAHEVVSRWLRSSPIPTPATVGCPPSLRTWSARKSSPSASLGTPTRRQMSSAASALSSVRHRRPGRRKTSIA